jgi:mono/diheme cytochrome c family protein
MKKLLSWLAGLIALTTVAATTVIYGGFYNIYATDQHLAPTYHLIDIAKRRAVKLRARDVEVPRLDDPAAIERGLGLFAQHCAHCHGAPGMAPASYALSMTPTPANLVDTARNWSPAELFLVIRGGIKMTGMPAWEFRLEERQIWDLVAFTHILPQLSPAQYAARVIHAEAAPTPASTAGAPDPQRGRLALGQYGCVTCHRIPGVVGANAPVGPPLDGIGSQAFIAGILPNTPANMERWLRDPQRFSPHNAMPGLGVSERDARDMAAYLATLQRPGVETQNRVAPRVH